MDRQHKPSRLARLIPTRRRLIQLYAALLYNAHLKGFIQGDIYTGPLKALCVPGFNCYSCPGAIGACPLGALQNALASSGNRGPWYVLGILMVLGLSLGRVICGWLCPLGLIQEWVHKLPTPKLGKGRFTRALSWLKYVILALFVVALPLAYALARFPLPAFCKYICPAAPWRGPSACCPTRSTGTNSPCWAFCLPASSSSWWLSCWPASLSTGPSAAFCAP